MNHFNRRRSHQFNDAGSICSSRKSSNSRQVIILVKDTLYIILVIVLIKDTHYIISTTLYQWKAPVKKNIWKS